ncbi:MAG: sugar transferase [Actinobacteria bacterium]|nr:sugar transferase [Actinomycetota bacterium]
MSDSHSALDVYWFTTSFIVLNRRDVTRGEKLDVVKRVLDLVLGSVLVVLTLPLWIVIPIAILLDDPGPVFYRQRRWGQNATQFDLYKFRSMRTNLQEVEIVQSSVHDPRVTRVGRLLRATGMDELPQLFNILRGDMSLVGPRALAVEEKLEINGEQVTYETLPQFRSRLEVRPGLTGLATIFAAKDVGPEVKFDYDLYYVRNRTMMLDIRLIMLSILISLRGRWETRGPKTKLKWPLPPAR